MSELLACPFCAQPNETGVEITVFLSDRDDIGSVSAYVECGNCDAHGPIATGVSEIQVYSSARRGWNSGRAKPAASDLERAKFWLDAITGMIFPEAGIVASLATQFAEARLEGGIAMREHMKHTVADYCVANDLNQHTVPMLDFIDRSLPDPQFSAR